MLNSAMDMREECRELGDIPTKITQSEKYKEKH